MKNRNKKYLFELEISFLKDRASVTEVPSSYTTTMYCTKRELQQDYMHYIEQAHLKNGGSITEFKILKQN
jgi:hypothetical protein